MSRCMIRCAWRYRVPCVIPSPVFVFCVPSKGDPLGARAVEPVVERAARHECGDDGVRRARREADELEQKRIIALRKDPDLALVGLELVALKLAR